MQICITEITTVSTYGIQHTKYTDMCSQQNHQKQVKRMITVSRN